jgi:hypothetical protein
MPSGSKTCLRVKTDDVAHVAVDELRSWSGDRGEPIDPLQGLGFPLRVIAERIVGDQSRRVQQQLLDRHLLLAVLAEPRQVLDDAVGQAELALFDQEHDRGGGGDGLGE